MRRRLTHIGVTVLLCTAAVVSVAAETPGEHLHASGIAILDTAQTAPTPLPASLAQALDLAMKESAAHPDDFGYPWIEPTTGTLMVAPVTAAGLARASQVRASAARIGVKRSDARLVKHSRTRLEHAMDAVIGRQPEGVVVRQSVPDPATNRVVLHLDRPDDAFLHRIAQTFEPSLFAVRLVDDSAPGGPAARFNDTTPFSGGASVNGCTDAFSWNSGSTEMMLSAGHCFPTGGGASTPGQDMGSVANASEESWNNGVGTVFMSGQSTYRGDIALIRLAGARQSYPYMYNGTSGSNSKGYVAEMWSRSPALGDQYCTGGKYSGQVCGWVVQNNVPANFTYLNGEVVRRIWIGYKSGWCVRPGDSGGPVYTVRPDGFVAAKGIISGMDGRGGSDFYAGALELPCVNVFSDIWDAFFGFPGILST